MTSGTTQQLQRLGRESASSSSTVFHQFAEQKNRLPYFLDHSHFFTFDPFSQQHFIQQNSHLLLPEQLYLEIDQGVCFALCMHWAHAVSEQNCGPYYERDTMDQFSSTGESTTMTKSRYPEHWNNELFFMECVSLQMEAQKYTMYELRLLFQKMRFRPANRFSIVQNVGELSNENSRLIQFLSCDTYGVDRFLLIFLSGSQGGHVICVARLDRQIAVFDPNEGTVSFFYQFAQQHARGAYDIGKLIQAHCSSYEMYEDIGLCEFVGMRNSKMKATR